MAEVQKLKAQAQDLLNQVWEIEKAEKDKENKTLINKCFKTMNSYSCPKDDTEWRASCFVLFTHVVYIGKVEHV